jgi:hypothetical protein
MEAGCRPDGQDALGTAFFLNTSRSLCISSSDGPGLLGWLSCNQSARRQPRQSHVRHRKGTNGVNHRSGRSQTRVDDRPMWCEPQRGQAAAIAVWVRLSITRRSLRRRSRPSSECDCFPMPVFMQELHRNIHFSSSLLLRSSSMLELLAIQSLSRCELSSRRRYASRPCTWWRPVPRQWLWGRIRPSSSAPRLEGRRSQSARAIGRISVRASAEPFGRRLPLATQSLREVVDRRRSQPQRKSHGRAV